MANTYHQLYIQVVFAVKYREAVIDNEWKFTLFGVIGNLINETGCKAIIVNGVEDHVHCFFGLIFANFDNICKKESLVFCYSLLSALVTTAVTNSMRVKLKTTSMPG